MTNKYRIINIAILLMTSLCVDVQAQSIRSFMYGFLDNYSRDDEYIKRSTLDSINVDTAKHSIKIYTSGGFKEQFFTDDIVDYVYSKVRTSVPDSLKDYKLQVITDNQPIEELVPNAIRKGAKSQDRLYKEEYKGAPWVKNISTPLSAPLGLENKHISLWQSHGTYWKQAVGSWMWQRPHLYCTSEDLFSQTFVIPYIIPMLENAGAIVYTPRDRDWQNNEVIVDNDAPEKDGKYIEVGKWEVCDSVGFAHLKNTYYIGDKPFKDGTVRKAETTNSQRHSHQIDWIPNIPEDGDYAVYVSYQTLPKSINDALYTVVHKGIKTEFKVNQQIGGSTWVYLGTFSFAKGNPDANKVILTNHSKENGIVTADAVRFGGGMGNIARGNTLNDSLSTTIYGQQVSKMPRWAEAALYYSQWAGMPDSVYNRYHSENDYNSDLYARTETVNTLAGGSIFVPNRKGRNVPFELTAAFHTDAGSTRLGYIGSLSICSTDYYGGKTANGTNRLASYDLSSLLLNNLSKDLQKYNWQVRQLWNRNYCETRETQVPSVILEMLSHQNFEDLKLGYDPKFKFDFCRSVYKTIVKYVAAQHSKSYVIQPLPVHNFAITLNDQDKWANLSWDATIDSLESTATPTKYIVYTRKDSTDFDNGTVVEGTSYLVPLEKGKLYSFKVVAMNDGGISFPSETLSCYAAPKNVGTVLIINAFTRLEGPEQISTATEQGFDIDSDPGVQYGAFAGFCGHQITYDKTNLGGDGSTATGFSGSELEGKVVMGNTFDYASIHGQGIKQLGNHSFCSTTEEAVLHKISIPTEYTMVDVIYGVQKKFNPLTCAILNNYCNRGGRLLVSGANLYNGEGFKLENLHARYGQEIKDKSINSVNGCNLNFNIYRGFNDKSYAVPRVMSLQATDGAFTMLQYSDNMGAAIAYDGTDYKTITVGFPIESIKDANQRGLLMEAITNFLCK